MTQPVQCTFSEKFEFILLALQFLHFRHHSIHILCNGSVERAIYYKVSLKVEILGYPQNFVLILTSLQIIFPKIASQFFFNKPSSTQINQQIDRMNKLKSKPCQLCEGKFIQSLRSHQVENVLNKYKYIYLLLKTHMKG